MNGLKNIFLKSAFLSAIALGYVVFSALDLEFSRRGNVISFKEEPFSFLLILLLLALPPLIILIGSSVLHIASNSDRDSWLNRKLRENAKSYEKAKKEAEEYNS